MPRGRGKECASCKIRVCDATAWLSELRGASFGVRRLVAALGFSHCHPTSDGGGRRKNPKAATSRTHSKRGPCAPWPVRATTWSPRGDAVDKTAPYYTGRRGLGKSRVGSRNDTKPALPRGDGSGILG